MKCPKCAEANERSRVYVGGTFSTAMMFNAFYDEDGVYHSHDPNVRTTQYSCSRGHHWSVESAPECSVEGCAWPAEQEARKARFNERARPRVHADTSWLTNPRGEVGD